MKKEHHLHADFYVYTGVYKKIEGKEVFEYKCSECEKEVWLERADEAPFKYEKKEPLEKKETVCWDV